MPDSSSQRRLKTLIEINRLITSTLDAASILSIILTELRSLIDVEGCSLLTVDEPTGELVFHTIEGGQVSLHQTRLKVGQGIVGWVVTHRKSVLTNNVEDDERFFPGFDQKGGFRTKSILCAPMVFRDKVIGAIEAINSKSKDGFQDEDLSLLEALCSQAAIALHNAEAYETVRLETEAYRQELGSLFRGVVGHSEPIRRAMEIAHRVARTKSTVLIRGESGTGKEVFARAIHNWSPRSSKPFMIVNTVALSPELLESELFGHEKGAFTGAISQKKGKFELAEGGTLFLDEIGDISLEIQTKLLRVLQDYCFQRVGGNQTIQADIRIIAATNRDLEEAISSGKFREDLYYRLNVVNLNLPPLRDHLEDIPELAEFFIAKTCHELGIPPLKISKKSLDLLMSFKWPGNIRQLANIIERAVILTSNEELQPGDFLLDRKMDTKTSDDLSHLPLSEALEEFKARLIRHALKLENGNQTRAAQRLGILQPNLSRMMKSLGIIPSNDSIGQHPNE